MSDRPSKELLNEFYNLAECDKKERLAAVDRLLALEDLEVHKEYVVSRLLAGLASARAASRHGFSTALTFVLKKFSEDFPLTKLISLADGKLDLQSQNDSSKNAIGYHLLCTSCYLSGRYTEGTEKILQKQLQIVSLQPFLKAAVVDSIVQLCNDENRPWDSNEFFRKHVLPTISAGLKKSFDQQTPEEFLLLVGLKTKFSKILRKELNVPVKKGRLIIEDTDFPAIIELLKVADKCIKVPLILAIFRLGRENGSFLQCYEGIVEPYALHGDERKGVTRYFELLNKLLAGVNSAKESEISIQELLAIFNEVMVKHMRKYSHRSDPAYRGVHLLIENLLVAYSGTIKNAAEEKKLDQTDLLKLIELLDSIEGGDFDTKVGSQMKFGEFLVGQLNAEYLGMFVDKAVHQEPWSLRRIEGKAFKSQSVASKVEILSKILACTSSPALFNIVCNLIDQCFVVKFRRFQFMDVVVSKSDLEVFVSVAANLKPDRKKKDKDVDADLSALQNFSAILRILSVACPDRLDKQQYLADAKEANQCVKRFDGGVFVDLLMSVVVRKNRVHKAIVYYACNALCSRIKTTDMKHVIQTIGRTDGQIAGDDDEDDDGDFKPITEQELIDLKNAKNGKPAANGHLTNGSSASEEESDSEYSSEDEEDETCSDTDDDEDQNEVDPKLVSDVRAALGKSAFLDENEENDDEEMSESEMIKLDDALGEAFRKNSSKEKRLHQEEFRVFRSKCIELLNIYFSQGDLTSVAPLAEPLKKLGEGFAQNGVKEFGPKIKAVLALLAERTKKQQKQGVKRKFQE